ncbi:MAG: hypothetical protein JO326_06770, partial [Acetobacteraceae bacterium]|nr:hypothetical protein [Acetobacteraceae bacterium]
MTAVALAGDPDSLPVTLIGHPFAPIGMGEQLRSHVASCLAVHLEAGVHDILRHENRADPAHLALLAERECRHVPGGVRIFHMNGDEIGPLLDAFAANGQDFHGGYNIVVPAWELPCYPKVWAEQLGRFDEVWALSRFIQASLQASGVKSVLIGQSVELPPGPFLPRRAFGLRESAFVLLSMFDLSSYASRKNPEAALALLERLRADDPFADVQLVLKVKDRGGDAREWAASLPRDQRLHVIAEPMDSFSVRSLIRACDCFLSLHRSEGFGRGLGEAMWLGRLAMGTAWSGNLDFMTPDNALLVEHKLVRLRRDAYPHAQGQRWAEADVAHAHALLRPVLADPARGRAIAARGQRDIAR